MQRSAGHRVTAYVLPPVLLACLLAGSLAQQTTPASRAAAATLSVRAVSPAPNTTEVTAATTIVVAFDRPVVALVGLGERTPPSPLVSNPALTGQGRWLTSSIYAYQAHDLRAATVYSVTVPAGLRAIDGTRLAQTYRWQFATVRPAVRDVSPGDGYAYAVPRPTISAGFNQHMDHAATQAAFHLRDSQNQEVPGTFSWSGDTLRFRPAAPLTRTASYTAGIDNSARSAEGPLPLLRPAGWRFSIAPYLTVTGSTPANGQTLGPQGNGVEVDFSAPVDEASAIDHVHITPDVPGRYISFGDDDLSLHIYGNFPPSTAYTMTIGAGLRARAGDVLRTPFRSHFVTAPLPSALSFVTGNVATYDAYRPVILSLQAINPGPITYTLYRLDRAAWVADLSYQYDLAHHLPQAEQIITSRTEQPRTVLNKVTPLGTPLTLPGGRPMPPGYYLAQAIGQGDAADYQLLLITRTNLTIKVSQRQVLLWATDLQSGRPVSGVTIAVLRTPINGGPIVAPPDAAATGAGGEVALGSGHTAADGTLLLNVPGIGPEESLVDMGVLALGNRAGDAIAASGSWGNGISPGDYGLASAAYQPARRISLYSDRPIYRPGQDVQVRGLVRADDDGRYSLVSGPVYMTLTDPQGKTVARRTLTLDRFGAFSATLPLALDASLGNYAVNVTSGDQGASTELQVAEYRKPTFAVTVTPHRATYTRGETIDADVQVHYYFGGPVANAKVHWSLLGYDYIFYSDLYPDYSFGAYDPAPLAASTGMSVAVGGFYPPYPRGGGYTLYQGNAVTDASGMLHLHLPARLPRDRIVQSYSLEANVTDLDNQPVANTAGVVVYSSAIQIGLQPEQQVVAVGKAERIHVVTLLNDGHTPAANQAVQIGIYRRTYRNRVIHNSDGSIDQQYVPHDTLLRTLAVQTDAGGQGAFAFSASSGGEYHLVASARDRFGNLSTSVLEIYAGGDQPIDWGFQPQGHIRVVPDKRTYHSGDTAHVLIAAPYANMQALISVERGHILTYSVRRLAGTGATLDVPIPPSYLPDTYVGVIVEQGARANGPPPVWRMGYARLHVDPHAREIHLNVRPAQPRAMPGQKLRLHIHATDHLGHPVQTQLSLSIVDAAALALAGDSGTGSDLLDTFYGMRELGVFTADTLNISPEQLLTKRAITRAFAAQGKAAVPAPTAEAPAAGGARAPAHDAQSNAAPPIVVRSHFADTAYWNAAVVTDAQGNATLVVALPDNLTTWSILGQGITADTLVGAGTASVIATKDLLLRPLLPRFFSLGDRARIGATVNNTTGSASTVRMRLLIADGTTSAGPSPVAETTIRLAAHAETDVTWPVTIATLGTATVQIQAIDIHHPAINDAVRLTLPVQENSTPELVADSGEVGSATREDVRIPANVEPNEGSLTLILEPTLAAGLRVGADFLHRYPYDSSIDLAARILGEAELGRLPARAAVLDAAERAALRPEIAGLLALLYPMQHGDGGFGWWIDDPYSSPYITVSAVEALTMARDVGYPVRASVLGNAVSYLIANTRSPAAINAGVHYDANLQAEIVYAVTLYGRGNEVATLGAQLFDARYLLSHYAAADLAVALHNQHTNADDAHVHTLLADLGSAAKLSATGTHWDEPDYDWADLDSDIAGTAIILDALVRLDPHNPLIAGAVRWLMAARKDNAWESTEATAAALRGLVDYTIASGELNGHYRYTVRRNGTPWATGQVDAGNLARSRTLTQPLGPQAPAGSTQRLTLGRQVSPGNGNLHYIVRLQYFRPVDRIGPAGAGVAVGRRYLVPGGSSGQLGSTIRVQLTVTAPEDLFYLTLEDPLPAGAEPVDSSLHTTSQLAQINNKSTIPSGTTDLSWYVTHTDLRDNRTVLFLGFLPAGTYQYTYLIHLSTAGTFHTLPTHISQTYFPEVFARGNGSYFQVQ